MDADYPNKGVNFACRSTGKHIHPVRLYRQENCQYLAALAHPNEELKAVSNATQKKLSISPSTKADSKDRYTPYRYDTIRDVAEKLAEHLDRDPS